MGGLAKYYKIRDPFSNFFPGKKWKRKGERRKRRKREKRENFVGGRF